MPHGRKITKTKKQNDSYSKQKGTKNHSKGKRMDRIAFSLNSDVTNPSTIKNTAPPKLSAAKQMRRLHMNQKQKELKQQQFNKRRSDHSSLSLEGLVSKANEDSQKFIDSCLNANNVENERKELVISDSSKRSYMKEMRKVIDQSDVILEVLDARDPMGCRAIDLEDSIISRGGKKLVLVLNKIDLIPTDVLQSWLKYLRGQFPTIAFKASTQEQGRNLAQTRGRADKFSMKTLSNSRSIGTDALLQLLKNYCRNANIKTSITCGVIGYPNVGKSSLINSLKRMKAVGVSSIAGYTKSLQEIHLDKKIKLLDCPGIVFDDSNTHALLLRNCLNVETMDDPITAVEIVLSRCTKEQMITLYQVSMFEDVIDFLVQVAQVKGKIGKGGIPDRKMAARCVLQDWNNGKIPFYTEAPTTSDNIVNTEIVTSWGEELDLDKMLNPVVEFPSIDMDTEKLSDPIPQPVCSFNTSSNLSMPSTSQMNIHTDSDWSSDSEEEIEKNIEHDGGHNKVLEIKNFSKKNSKLFEEDSLNPPTAQMSRKQMKQIRKLKRRCNRHMDQELEDVFCMDMTALDCS